jgi:hypothetical protein
VFRRNVSRLRESEVPEKLVNRRESPFNPLEHSSLGPADSPAAG